MSRVKFTTNIEEDLLKRAKAAAETEGLVGANEVIEKALHLYFANCSTQVWEKPLNGGWLKKMIVRPGKVVIECIRSRKVKEKYNPQYYTCEVLEPRGWHKVWQLPKASNT